MYLEDFLKFETDVEFDWPTLSALNVLALRFYVRMGTFVARFSMEACSD